MSTIIAMLFFSYALLGGEDEHGDDINNSDAQNIAITKAAQDIEMEKTDSLLRVFNDTRKFTITDPDAEDDFVALEIPLSANIQEYAWRLCDDAGIDFSLVLAIIKCESGYCSDVISATGDYGLMQINQINHDSLADKLGITDFLDPYQNIECGIYILSDFFDRYNDTSMVLMAYNMGDSGAAALWKQGIYSTAFTDKVLEAKEKMDLLNKNS